MQIRASIANFLRAFRFPVYVLSGEGRFGGGALRLLYAGGPLFRAYLESVAYKETPAIEYLGKRTFGQIRPLQSARQIDLGVTRSHISLARAGLFPNQIFVPEWIAGVAYLSQQQKYEQQSQSRQRDRQTIASNGISYEITTAAGDLNHFYDHMYVPHISTSHGSAALLMSRDKMFERVRKDNGKLIAILMDGRMVAGSFIVHERGLPRLQSSGVLNRDIELMRKGVGAAIYLLTFDYLASRGFDKIHMGLTRALLSDGVLYFKKRFGLQTSTPSRTGHYFDPVCDTTAVRQFLASTGFIHIRRRSTRAAVLEEWGDKTLRQQLSKQKAMAEDLGIAEVDRIEISSRPDVPNYRISNVKVAHRDS